LVGLSGIGLSAAPDGNIYLLGGNLIAEDDAGAGAAGGGGGGGYGGGGGDGGPGGYGGYGGPGGYGGYGEYGEPFGPFATTTSCDDTTTTSSTKYNYANFFKFDPSEESIALTALTATSSDAENLCPPTSEACKEYFGPSPSASFNIVSQATDQTGWSQTHKFVVISRCVAHVTLLAHLVSTGMLLFLHAETGDWWQCNVFAVPARWTRSNGIVEGRAVEV
jgi:hypothetical protein